MGNCVDIDEYKPHLMIPGKIDVHVMPRVNIEKVANRKTNITQLEDYEDWLPTILKEWLENNHEERRAGRTCHRAFSPIL